MEVEEELVSVPLQIALRTEAEFRRLEASVCPAEVCHGL
jgi:hypothetical protein